MKYIKTLTFLAFVFLLGSQLFAQSTTQKIKLRGKDKLKKELEVNIKTSRAGDNKVTVTIDILKNEGDYTIHLFDDRYKKGTTPSTWNNLYNIYSTWLKQSSLGKKMKANINRDDLSFDGNFVSFNPQRLERKLFSTGRWSINKKNTRAASFEILNGDSNSKGGLWITYSFLITEAKTSGIVLVGLSEGISFTIPENYYAEPLTQPIVNVNPVDKKVAQWEKTVNDILVTFVTEDCFSYDDIKKSSVLKSEYERQKTKEKIEEAINNINNELSAPEYRQKKAELIFKLKQYNKPDETNVAVNARPAEKAATEPTKKTTQKSSVTSKTSSASGKLSGKYKSAQRAIDSDSKKINALSSTIDGKINELSEKLDACKGDFKCYSQIKSAYDVEYNQWTNTLDLLKNRLNNSETQIKSIENNQSYSKSGLNTSSLKNDLTRLRSTCSSLKEKMDAFNYEAQEHLMNKDAFNLVAALLKSKSLILQQRLNYAEANYNFSNDKYYSGRELAQAEVEQLKQTKQLVDSVSHAIDNILAEAKKRYGDETGSKPLPESLFINEIELPAKKDCNFLKADIEKLLTDIGGNGGFGDYMYQLLGGIVLFILLLGAYIYFRAVIKRKVSKQNTGDKSGSSRRILSEEELGDGMEILEDNDERLKAKGLDVVRKLNKIKYFEFDVQKTIKNTAVRHVYFSNEFIIDSYEYFQDKMVEIGSHNLDSLYEYGGYIIGRWDVSLYDDEQYDISLEHFIKPGDDAKFSKFNIDFGYEISFNMETKLIDLAKQGNDQVLIGWLHSHPGHNVFLSNYDIEVQETFRNQYHPNRHVALVFDPNTNNWDMGLFTFNKAGVMNNKEEVTSLMNFHELYDWALGKHAIQRTPNLFRFEYAKNGISGRHAYSFDKLALSKLKRWAARKLKDEGITEMYYPFYGVKENAGKLGTLIHSLDIKDNHEEPYGSLVETGVFGFNDTDLQDKNILELSLKIIKSKPVSFLLLYQKQKDNFLFIPITNQMEIAPGDNWKEFSEKDFLPYLTDSSITTY